MNMKKILMMVIATLMATVAMISCSNDDSPVEPAEQVLQDGVWTGSGEGRSGAIIVKVTVENLVEHAPATISWLTGLGADLSDVGLMGGSSVKRTHRPKGGTAIGPHLMKVLREATSVKNIEIRTSNKVTGLLSAVDGSVTGVKVQNANGSTYTLTARAVIIDEDFGRSATEMTASLESAPYYAVRVTPAIHHTMGGLCVNTETQVLKADGTPIPGLYAAGEVTGGLHGANRLGGNGVADIVVNGRLAGITASKKLKYYYCN